MNAMSQSSQLASEVYPTRTASLTMYDLEGLQAANDALWSAIASALEVRGVVGAPQALLRGQPLDPVWSDPDLLLGQACGYPLGDLIANHQVRLVATPRYQAPGCDGPYHRSAVVVRADSRATALADLFGGRCALNDYKSNSGMNLLRFEVAPLARDGRFFGSVVITGSHQRSAEQVAEGASDVAAIDCITLAHLQRLRPDITRRLKVLTWTVRSPGLPLITGRNTDAATYEALCSALEAVERDPGLQEVRAALMLKGFNALPAPHYCLIGHFEQMAIAQGFPTLS